MTVTEVEYDDGSLRLSVRFDPNETPPLDELLTDSHVKLSVYDRGSSRRAERWRFTIVFTTEGSVAKKQGFSWREDGRYRDGYRSDSESVAPLTTRDGAPDVEIVELSRDRLQIATNVELPSAFRSISSGTGFARRSPFPTAQ
jgi:hypothetical protein